MKGYTARLMSLVAMFGLAVSTLPANAGGVVVTASVPSNGEINSFESAAVPTYGYATTTIAWTSSALYQSGAQIQVVASPALGNAFQECSSGSSIGGASYTTGSWSTSGGTFSLTGNASTNSISLCLLAYVESGAALIPAQNFSLSVVTTGATVDYGAAMFYVNGGNDVLVSATVPATLSFEITDPSNLSLLKNVCNLGVLSTASVKECQYRLKVVTNAQNGFTTTYFANHDMATAAYATLTNVADATVTAGSEEYGFNVDAANYGGRDNSTGIFNLPATGALSEASDFALSTSPQTLVSSANAFYVSTSALGATSLVSHRASIAPTTNVGLYQQTVTYRTVGHF